MKKCVMAKAGEIGSFFYEVKQGKCKRCLKEKILVVCAETKKGKKIKHKIKNKLFDLYLPNTPLKFPNDRNICKECKKKEFGSFKIIKQFNSKEEIKKLLMILRL